jgi:glucokinase
VIGIDLGGTNLRVALYGELAPKTAEAEPADADADAASAAPEPIARRRDPVGEPRDPDIIVTRIADAIRDVVDRGQTHPAVANAAAIPVGIGFAGMLRGDDGHVANSPHLRWRDVPLGRMLAERLGPRYPVVIDNDVNAITYGEYTLGAGRGVRDILAVFVGTGIGAGIISDGRLLVGAGHAAGEIGHFKVAYGDDAPACACGRRGCVETFVGGAYLQRRARAELAAGAQSAAVRHAGGAAHVHPGHLDRAAADGDAYALELYAEVTPLLAATLANAINLLNPARLILGGGVLSRTPVLRAHVVAALPLGTTDAALASLTIVDAALGDDAGLVGSAALAAARYS